MDLTLTAEQRALQRGVREWAAANLNALYYTVAKNRDP